MIFAPTPIEGAYVVDLERHVDDRGSFARAWCAREFGVHNVGAAPVQLNISANPRRGTLRGLHYSVPPRAEAKFIRCIRGSVYDVIVDLRPSSSSFLQWHAETLSAANGRGIYVPEGVAHGFQTVEDQTDVLYQMSEFHDSECARGVRWNDARFEISWPETPTILSERDRNYPDFVGTRQ